MRSHLSVIKAVLPIAPGAEDQGRIPIGIHNVVGPARRYHYLFAGIRLDSKAAARVIFRFLLAKDDSTPFPYLEQFGG